MSKITKLDKSAANIFHYNYFFWVLSASDKASPIVLSMSTSESKNTLLFELAIACAILLAVSILFNFKKFGLLAIASPICNVQV